MNDAEKIVECEKEKNPEVFKILQDLVGNKKSIWYKDKETGQFVEVPFADDTNYFTAEDGSLSDVVWQLDLHLQHGIPRLTIDIINFKDIEYLEEHMPCLNYFPTSLLLEDYGTLWRDDNDASRIM